MPDHPSKASPRFLKIKDVVNCGAPDRRTQAMADRAHRYRWVDHARGGEPVYAEPADFADLLEARIMFPGTADR